MTNGGPPPVRAVVDCGSNSTRLWLRADPDGEVVRREQVTRLAEDVDASGRLASAAIDRTIKVLADHARRWRAVDVTPAEVVVIATSAVRDAGNRDEFRDRVVAVTGVAPRVLTGQQEAAGSFVGATMSLAQGTRALVIDIGGGSTELVLGAAGAVDGLQAVSLQLGTVRLTERAMEGDPPTPEQVTAARGIVSSTVVDGLAEIGPADHDGDLQVMAVAGTATTLAALDGGSAEVDVVDGHVLAPAALADLTRRLVAASVDERMAMGPLAPGRADVIAAGALILDTIVDALGRPPVTVSVRDVMDGIAATGDVVMHDGGTTG